MSRHDVETLFPDADADGSIGAATLAAELGVPVQALPDLVVGLVAQRYGMQWLADVGLRRAQQRLKALVLNGTIVQSPHGIHWTHWDALRVAALGGHRDDVGVT